MQTRSSSRLVSNPSSNPTPSKNPNPKGRNRRHSKQRIKEFNLDELSPPIVTMADQPITIDNFELKHGFHALVQNKQFFGHDKEDPHAYIRYFNKITSTLKFPNVSNTEAWDRFKDLLRACPHHGFLELHQLDTFYNALNSKDQDSLNSAAGGNCLDKMPRGCLAIIESKSKVRYSRNKPVVAKRRERTQCNLLTTEALKTSNLRWSSLILILTSEPVNSPISEPVAYPVSAPRPNLKPSIPYPSILQDQKLRDKANNQREKIFQIFKDLNFNISFADALILMPKFGPSIKSLLTNKDKLCELIKTPLNEHCSAVLLKKLPEKLGDPCKFLIPCDFPRKAECLALADLSASINLMPLSMWNKLSLPDLTPTCMTLELADRSISHSVGVAQDVYVKVGELTLFVGKEAITFNLDQTSRYSANYSDMAAKQIVVIDMACEEYSQEVMGFSDVISNGNPTPYYESIVSTTSPTLTPFENSDFLLEEVDAFLAIEDDPTLLEVDQSYLDPEGDILLLEAFLNDDPSLPPSTQGNYLPEVELRDLPPHLKYAFLEGNDKFPVIIAKYLSAVENTALIIVLKSHKRAIAWKLSDIKGIDPEFCTYKILMEEYFEPVVQHQRRVNPKIHDVIKQEEFFSKLSLPFRKDAGEDMPFELMCDASDFAIGAVLGQHQDKHFRPIHYASKTMTEFAKVMQKFGVTHRLATPYHPQTSGQVEVSNHGLKHILKRAVGENRASWSDKLNDALWAFRTAYKIPIGCTPYKLVYGKACHLPIELEHKAYWALKHANFDLKTSGDHRKVQINKLNELRDQAYENSLIYKEKTKRLHESKIKDRVFNIGDIVLLFNSRLKIFLGKLKSRWFGPFTISQVYPYGTIDLSQPDGPNFKVNGHRLKHYVGEDVPKVVVPDL
uniref:Reverse transcriptase domain-containing protein n=1 Tax=Tanacetum cinerariifolium TaxID=118510 RepID=A0A6L2JVA4_TANCI|nr:reverse transcriptase domain-containing protein [Tanacetum cinerariifolium]